MAAAWAIAAMSASPAWASRTTQPTYWFCNAWYHAGGSPFITTNVVEIGPGIYPEDPVKEWNAWLDAAVDGKVPLDFDKAATSLEGGCRGFFTREGARAALDNHLRLDSFLRQISSPLDASGKASIPGRAVAAVAPRAAPKSKVATGAATTPAAPAKTASATAAGSAGNTPKTPAPVAADPGKPLGPGPGRVTRRVVTGIVRGTEEQARWWLNVLHRRYPERYSEARNIKCFDMSKGAGRAWSCVGERDEPAVRPQKGSKQ